MSQHLFALSKFLQISAGSIRTKQFTLPPTFKISFGGAAVAIQSEGGHWCSVNCALPPSAKGGWRDLVIRLRRMTDIEGEEK